MCGEGAGVSWASCLPVFCEDCADEWSSPQYIQSMDDVRLLVLCGEMEATCY